MSIICSEVELPQGYKHIDEKNKTKLLRTTIDPTTYSQLPFSSDYKFLSCMLPEAYQKWAERIQTFRIRPDDVFVLGFPKSGTTWMQNIVHSSINGLDTNAEFISPVYNYLEYPILYDKIQGEDAVGISEKLHKSFDALNVCPSPRLIKSHLLPQLLPKEVWNVKPKLIYIERDVKDVVLSMLHMIRNVMFDYAGTDSDFYRAFRNNYTTYGPFYEHIKSFQQLRHLDHLFYITYEELSSNTFDCVKRISEFLGHSYDDAHLQRLVEHVSFGKMRNKLQINQQKPKDPNYRFCRKGKVGSYREEMSEEDIHFFDEFTAQQKQKLEISD